MAIDRDAIIKDVYLGAGEKAKTLIPPTMWSYDDAIVDYPYDPEKAKAMLAAAGVTTPLDIDLWYQPVQRPYNPNGKRIGEMMQADLAKIGVNAKLVTFEWGEYRKRLQNAEDETGQMGWTGDNGDPDNFFFLLGCADGKPAGNNIPKWCNAEFNDLLVKARTIPDQAERAKLYTRMQEIEHDEAPSLLIAHSTSMKRCAPTSSGYKQSPLGIHMFKASTSSKRARGPSARRDGPRTSSDAPMLVYFLRRLALTVPTFVALMFVTFVAIRLVPGDPVEVRVGEHGISPERLAYFRHQLGLDLPVWRQFLDYCWRLLHGDFGVSLSTQQKVLTEFLTLFPATIELSLCAMLFAIAVGVPAGAVAAVKRGSVFDQGLMTVSLFGYSMPIFWWGLLLIMFVSVKLELAAGLGPHRPHQLLLRPADRLHDDRLAAVRPARRLPRRGASSDLPAIVLGTVPLGVIARMTRSSMLEVLSEDYVRTARAKGLSPFRVIGVHALRNALLPVVTVIGLSVSSLLAGAVLTETIFSWPGVGHWLIEFDRPARLPGVAGRRDAGFDGGDRRQPRRRPHLWRDQSEDPPWPLTSPFPPVTSEEAAEVLAQPAPLAAFWAAFARTVARYSASSSPQSR